MLTWYILWYWCYRVLHFHEGLYLHSWGIRLYLYLYCEGLDSTSTSTDEGLDSTSLLWYYCRAVGICSILPHFTSTFLPAPKSQYTKNYVQKENLAVCWNIRYGQADKLGFLSRRMVSQIISFVSPLIIGLGWLRALHQRSRPRRRQQRWVHTRCQ